MSDAPKPPGPAGTWCQMCGLYPVVNGCTAERCATIDTLPPAELLRHLAEDLTRPRWFDTDAGGRAAAQMHDRVVAIADQMAPAPAAPVEARVAESVPFVASRSELGAPTVHLPPGLQRTPEQEAFVRDWREVEHPAPWRWGPDFLADANGMPVVNGWTASPRVRALTEAAPETEALLRERRPVCDQVESAREEFVASRHWRPGAPLPEHPICGNCWPCRVNALLARIDERSR